MKSHALDRVLGTLSVLPLVFFSITFHPYCSFLLLRDIFTGVMFDSLSHLGVHFMRIFNCLKQFSYWFYFQKFFPVLTHDFLYSSLIFSLRISTIIFRSFLPLLISSYFFSKGSCVHLFISWCPLSFYWRLSSSY
jgi:hypothetical protein